jgi:septal ring factor EnvC (AmiA/AmiB activator)
MRFLIVPFLCALILHFYLPIVCSASDMQTNVNSQITTLQKEVETLKAENEALKMENRSLHRMLAAKQQQATDSATAVPKPPSGLAPTQQQTGYWITISSGVRHNSSCRYYMNSKGRPCGPNEGRPCKLCGG